MATINLVPSSPGGNRNALRDLLETSTIYEKAGAVIPKDLLQFGIYGAVVVIATGLLALVLPNPTSIAQGELFLVLASTAASLDSLIQGLAIPAIVSGIALLLLDVYLLVVPTTERWRRAVVGQAAIGGAGGALSVIFLALLVLNIALWIAICACILAGCVALLAGLAGG